MVVMSEYTPPAARLLNLEFQTIPTPVLGKECCLLQAFTSSRASSKLQLSAGTKSARISEAG